MKRLRYWRRLWCIRRGHPLRHVHVLTTVAATRLVDGLVVPGEVTEVCRTECQRHG